MQFTKIYSEIFDLGLNPSEFKVFTYLLSKSYFKNFRSQAVIAKDCDISRTNIKRILASLVSKGLLKIKSGQLKHKSNDYEVEKDYAILAIERQINTAIGDNLESLYKDSLELCSLTLKKPSGVQHWLEQSDRKLGILSPRMPWDLFCSIVNPILAERLGDSSHDARGLIAQNFKILVGESYFFEGRNVHTVKDAQYLPLQVAV